VEEVAVGVQRLDGQQKDVSRARHAEQYFEAVESEICNAIRFHIDGLRADGIVVPQPTSIAEYVET
jgi:hypothetical protein